MSVRSWIGALARLTKAGSSKRLAGKDLEGNKYFELPPVNSGRTKRVVEYKIARDLADYTSGTHRLPIQWTTWLSHTRADPPSIAELEHDRSRRERLGPLVSAIEERETEERIRQGYLPSPEAESVTRQIAGPSGTSRHSGQRYHLGQGASRINAAPSFVARPSGSAGNQDGTSTWSAEANRQIDPHPQSPQNVLPTSTSPGVAPPPNTVDPAKYSSPEELRRLAEEDTKRRMQETGESPLPTTSSPSPTTPSNPTFKPRRRGAG